MVTRKSTKITPDTPVEPQKCKVVFVGEKGSGKTSLIKRFCDDKYDAASPTVGSDFFSKTMKVGPRFVQYNIWDLSGD